MAAKTVPGVLGSFAHVDAAVEAIGGLKAKGFRDLTVYTAAPNHEIEDALDHPVSGVRLFTLIGGLTGVTAGFAMTIWMSRDWPLLVGGKPIAAIPPYVVLAFELTILYGSLCTVAGMIILSLAKSLKGRPFHPRFSDDRIGVFVPCTPEQSGAVRELLAHAGSEEVTVHGA
jgi:molybdopterin-containing oxidoreductase family membrane subunit